MDLDLRKNKERFGIPPEEKAQEAEEKCGSLKLLPERPDPG